MTDDQAVAGSVERMAARLRAVARAGRTVTYNDLAAAVGWDMDDPAAAREVAGILRAISTAEHAAGRPLLSVVVVGAKAGRPGKGFFKLAQRLGRYDGAADRDLLRSRATARTRALAALTFPGHSRWRGTPGRTGRWPPYGPPAAAGGAMDSGLGRNDERGVHCGFLPSRRGVL